MSSSCPGSPSPLFFQLLPGAPVVFQVTVVNLWPQDWPRHHANRATCTTLTTLTAVTSPSPALFLLTPRKANMALVLEFDLGWGAERGRWGMRAWRGGDGGSRHVRGCPPSQVIITQFWQLKHERLEGQPLAGRGRPVDRFSMQFFSQFGPTKHLSPSSPIPPHVPL